MPSRKVGFQGDGKSLGSTFKANCRLLRMRSRWISPALGAARVTFVSRQHENRLFRFGHSAPVRESRISAKGLIRYSYDDVHCRKRGLSTSFVEVTHIFRYVRYEYLVT